MLRCRRASKAATAKTLEAISQQYEQPVNALKEEYSNILRDKTLNAFSDGKTSFEYRRERFTTLLERFSLAQDVDFIDRLLGIYEDTLTQRGFESFRDFEREGQEGGCHHEGPQDAQERTVKQLGLAGHVDFLATTNFFRVSKTEGLFPRVLEHLGIQSSDMVYIGDNPVRDTVPARDAGIFDIHYNEQAETSLEGPSPQVKSLAEVEALL
ncbi:Haloacid dehalogenase-like hydrolase [Colletotrichum asianum]